jgi:hypothetical protein
VRKHRSSSSAGSSSRCPRGPAGAGPGATHPTGRRGARTIPRRGALDMCRAYDRTPEGETPAKGLTRNSVRLIPIDRTAARHARPRHRRAPSDRLLRAASQGSEIVGSSRSVSAVPVQFELRNKPRLGESCEPATRVRPHAPSMTTRNIDGSPDHDNSHVNRRESQFT